MESLRHRLGQPLIALRRLLLSAIIPSHDIEDVAIAHGLSDNFCILRMSTARKNLSYNVVKVGLPPGQKSSDALISRLETQMKSEVERIVRDSTFSNRDSAHANLSSPYKNSICDRPEQRIGGTSRNICKHQIVVYAPTCDLVQEIVNALEQGPNFSKLRRDRGVSGQPFKSLTNPVCIGNVRVVFQWALSYYARLRRADREATQSS